MGSPPRKSYRASFGRSIPAEIRQAVRKYAQEAGEVTWAWNRLHSALQLLFATIIDPKDLKLGTGIWQSLRSDDSQRELLRAAAIVRLAKNTAMLKRIDWLVDRTGKLGGFRNDPTHTPVMHTEQGGKMITMPEPMTATPARAARLNAVGYSRLYRALRGDLLHLSFYALRLRSELMAPGLLGALPKRPPSQAIELVQKFPPPKNTPKRRPRSRKRQRKPSQR